MDECDIVKSGDLSMQVKGMFKSSWPSKFCVLYGRSSDSHPYLEIYESKKSFHDVKTMGKKCDKKIALRNARTVSKYTQGSSGSKEYYIEIKFRRDKQLFLFDSEHDSNDWYAKLYANIDSTVKGDENSSSSVKSGELDDNDVVMTENLVYEGADEIPVVVFEVTVLDTDLAKLCQILGKHKLFFHPTSMAFENPKTKQIQQTIPFVNVRRYGREKEITRVFCGRKFVNGEGVIMLRSDNVDQAKNIHKIIVERASVLSVRGFQTVPETSERPSASSHEQVNTENSNSRHVPPHDSPGKHFEMSSATNMFKKHPGQTGPTLVPLPNQIDNSNTSHSPECGLHDGGRHSTKEADTKDRMPEVQRARSVGASVRGVTNAFTKQLENKLILGAVNSPETAGGESGTKSEDSELKESKTEKALSEKDKKKCKKEEERQKKKQREELEKRKKEEQKAAEKLNKKKEKERKDKSKGKEKSKGGIVKETPVVTPNTNIDIYEEVDTNSAILPVLPTPQENMYDEAAYTMAKVVTPVPDPVEYSQPFARTEVRSVRNNFSEYAEPYAGSQAVAVKSEPVMYSDADNVRLHGWKSHGRKEEEEFHEEDYSNIKRATQSQKSTEPPQVPIKKYNEDEVQDDTYNKIDFKHPESKLSQQNNSGNIYGVASGKAIGPVTPSRPLMSHRSCDLGEVYVANDDCDNYDNRVPLPKTKQSATQDANYYDEATIASPQTPPPPQESLYELVP